MKAFASAAITAAMLVMANPAPALAQAMRLDGWWVVLASVKDDGTQAPHRQIEVIRRRMLACKVEIFSDASAKFVGFAPGYQVAAIGAYRSEAEAKAQLPKVSSCEPKAYVKKARHAGE